MNRWIQCPTRKHSGGVKQEGSVAEWLERWIRNHM